MCCRLDGFQGELTLDAEEVQDTKWQQMEDLYRDVKQEPERFTPWLRAELAMLQDVLSGNNGVNAKGGLLSESEAPQWALARCDEREVKTL